MPEKHLPLVLGMPGILTTAAQHTRPSGHTHTRRSQIPPQEQELRRQEGQAGGGTSPFFTADAYYNDSSGEPSFPEQIFEHPQHAIGRKAIGGSCMLSSCYKLPNVLPSRSRFL